MSEFSARFSYSVFAGSIARRFLSSFVICLRDQKLHRGAVTNCIRGVRSLIEGTSRCGCTMSTACSKASLHRRPMGTIFLSVGRVTEVCCCGFRERSEEGTERQVHSLFIVNYLATLECSSCSALAGSGLESKCVVGEAGGAGISIGIPTRSCMERVFRGCSKGVPKKLYVRCFGGCLGIVVERVKLASEVAFSCAGKKELIARAQRG